MHIVSLLWMTFAASVCGIYLTRIPRESWDTPTLDVGEELPATWDWRNINGTNFLTKNLNQHLPQWCGSCWAHGALSSLADRVKIARRAHQPDINLPVQFLLNCGDAGTCNGGDHLAAYRYIKDSGGIPFDTCLDYEACSHDSRARVCHNRNFSCIAENVCRSCPTYDDCAAIYSYPNVTIESYTALRGYNDMMNEIYKHGPIACGVAAPAIEDYQGGIVDLPTFSKNIDHIISIVGWGYDNEMKKKYWIVRNSWGEYWGELGFFRIVLGENQLGIEGDCAAAIPGNWTKKNKACDLDGKNCAKMRY